MLEVAGFSVRIYLPPREHGPAHVHVFRGGGQAIILLGDDSMPPAVRDVYGMTDREALAAYHIVKTYQAQLCRAWRRYHG